MADFNVNQNGVFGGVQFNGENNNENETNTSFFEGVNQNTNSTYNFGNAVPGTENNTEWGTNQNNGKNEWGTTIPTNSNTTENGVNENYGKFGTINTGINNTTATNFQPITKEKSIAKQSLWSKIRAFLFKEINWTAPIKVELTPYQQKVEDEINEFLHQEVSFKNIAKLFKSKK